MHLTCSRPDLSQGNSQSFNLATRVLPHLRSLVAVACVLSAIGAAAQTNPKHFFWAPGQTNSPSASSLTNDLIYHGGNAGTGAIGVETVPATYLIFWGPDWQNGFTTADLNGAVYTSQQLQTYVTSFLTNLGGTSWDAVNDEYCNNVAAGTTSCAAVGGGNYVTSPRKQLKGVWTDTTTVPADIVALGLAENLADDPLATEAIRASAHFNYDPQATYIILTPPTAIATGQPVYCGYHTQTNSVDGLGNPYRLQYAFIPFLNASWPGLGQTGCGMNSVNVISDSFGHGVFDGYSIVTGHEYEEAITDPDNFATVQDGWNDAQGNETGDKCAWTDLANVNMYGGTSFAVQPLWSNRSLTPTARAACDPLWCIHTPCRRSASRPRRSMSAPATASVRRAQRPVSPCPSTWPTSADTCRWLPSFTSCIGDGEKPAPSITLAQACRRTIPTEWAR